MDEEDRIRRIEFGKKLLQQRQKKKKSRKKNSNAADISTDAEVSIVDDKSFLSESIDGKGYNEANRTKMDVLVANQNPGTSSSEHYFNDGLESLESIENLKGDKWDPHTNAYQPQPILSIDGDQTNHTSLSNKFTANSAHSGEGLTFHENSELEQHVTDPQDIVTQLQNRIITLSSEKQQILNELHESRFGRKMSSSYTSQISSLQQSLVQTERRLQIAEQKHIEADRAYREQIEKYHCDLSEQEQKYSRVFEEQERKHAKILREHNQTHSEHISRITAQLGNQIEPAVIDIDSDEQEAERLKMIKEKMREMHEIEKSQLLSEHAKEKEELETNYQRQVESYRLNAEKSANSQIKGIYEQFVVAHKALEDQKKALDAQVKNLNEEVDTLRAQVNSTLVEKTALEEKYKSLLDSKSAEIEYERNNYVTLEMKLNDWTEKASKLEAKLNSSESETSIAVSGIHREKDEAIFQVRSECEKKITSMQLVIDEFQAQLHESESLHRRELGETQAKVREDYLEKLQESAEQHQKEIKEIITKYEDNLNDLRTEHATEVDLLEASIGGVSGEKASLEVAEEHMKSLQDQLKRFRSQEQSFEARIDDLNQQHVEDISVLRKQLQDAKYAEVEREKADLSSKIKNLEKMLIERDKASSNEEILDNLKTKHQEEVAELKDASNKELVKALHELKTSHREEIDRLNCQMSSNIETLKANSDEQMRNMREEAIKKVRDEMEALRLEHIQQLDIEYGSQISQLKQSLLQAEKDALAKSDEKVKAYKGEVVELNADKSKLELVKKDLLSQLELLQRQRHELEESIIRMEAERNQLSEDSDRFQKRVKNLEVDVSISKSTEEHKERILEQVKLDLNEKELELSNAKVEIDDLKVEVKCMQEEYELEQQKCLDQMARKDKEIGDARAETDSLKSAVDSLTKKHQEDLRDCETLKNQLESSWGVNEELEALKQHVMELKAYKESYEDTQLKMSSLEESNHSKNEIIDTLRVELDRSSQVLAEASVQCEEDRTNSCKEVEELRTDVARLTESEVSLKMIIESESRKNSQIITGLEQLIEESKSKLMVAESKCEKYNTEVEEMNRVLEELQSQLTFLTSKEGEQLTEMAEKDQIIEDLNLKLALALSTEKENATKMDEMNHVIDEMQIRIASLETELHENDETNQDLHQSIEDLESKLSIADDDVLKLEDEKSRLELDLLQSQGDSLTSNSDTDQLELKFTKLEKDHEELLKERSNLISEVKSLSENSNSKSNLLEVKIKSQEEIIRDLHDKLTLSESSFNIGKTSQHGENLSSTSLETTLSRARQALTEKLQEKSAIEIELHKRRVTLERQQAEKQHLEDLLYEKKRFEQELQNQKNILQKELVDLETKLKLKN